MMAGCKQNAQLPTSNPLCTLDSSIAEAMNTVADILENMSFTVEKFDVEKGVITTKPLRGGQLFEPWRKENVGARNFQLANLHSIMRTVTVTVTRQDDQTCLDCQVALRRLAVSGRPIDGFSNLAAVFTESKIDLQKLKIESKYEWIDLADDEKLEYAILQRLRNENEKS